MGCSQRRIRKKVWRHSLRKGSQTSYINESSHKRPLAHSIISDRKQLLINKIRWSEPQLTSWFHIESSKDEQINENGGTMEIDTNETPERRLYVRHLIPDTDEIVGQPLDDADGLRLLGRSDVLGDQDCLCRLDEDTSVSPFFSVHASTGCINGEELLV